MAGKSMKRSQAVRFLKPNSGLFCSIAISVILAAAAQSSGFLNLTSIRNLATTALGIGFIIFVHELGHFLVAKACGVKCEKFYLGFDVYGLKLAKFQWGETEYGIGAVPLGGYVKMLGQDDNVANAEGEAERTKLRNPDGTVTLDPRSYTAKSIPQRMAIISAGVIMNLIFAVIFASIAFNIGAEYEPCVIGSLTGGSAAWKAGIEPGDRILQFGKNGSPSHYLRYQSDLLERVFLHDLSEPLDLLVEKPSGEQKWVSTHPQKTFDRSSIFGDKFRPKLGVGQSESLNLLTVQSDSDIPLPKSMQWTEKVQAGDRLIAANSQALNGFLDFARLEIENFDKPITLKIERTRDQSGKKIDSPTTYEVVLPPKKRLELGAYFRAGAISTVLAGSIAETAGILTGDMISKINGKEISDPTTLPNLFASLGGVETTLSLLRGKESIEIKLTPAKATRVYQPTQGSEVTIDGLGICFPVENVVAFVDPKLKEQKIDIAVGDVVTAIRQEYPTKDKKPKVEKWASLRKEQHDGELISFLADDDSLIALHLRLQRGDKTIDVRLVPFEGDAYSLSRPIQFQPLREIRQTSSPSEALSLGLRETKESGLKVLGFLLKLVTGGVSPTNLGGPGAIFYVANREASLGFSRFLLFLTLISANLAIVNFLPIPVLDGGHMMFLTAEFIRGKPVDEKWLIRLSVMGLFFVLSLMLFVISLDVLRFSGVSV